MRMNDELTYSWSRYGYKKIEKAWVAMISRKTIVDKHI